MKNSQCPVHRSVPEFLKEVVLTTAPALTKDQLAVQNVLQLNTAMFGIYDNSLAMYQKNIRANVPLIMGLFSGQGGRFVLYRPGHEPQEAPRVPVIYELCKSVGHCAMATYALVAPYAANSKENTAWISLMKTYQTEISTAQESIKSLPIKPEEQTLLQDTLSKILQFMETCLKNKSYTYEELAAFARGVEPYTEKLIALSSATQVGHWYEVLTEWKALLGKDWDRAYALSNSIYVARQNNILFSILVQFMGEETINNRLLLLETTDFETTPEDMFDAFSRIVSDRVLGQIFFANDRLMDFELLGFGGRAAIEAEANKRGQKAILLPLVAFNSNEWPWKTDTSKGSGPTSFDDLHKLGLLQH